MPIDIDVPGAPGRCPYCHDLLTEPMGVVACAACGARHHEGCHHENARCATCGSTNVLVPRSSEQGWDTRRPPDDSVIEVVEQPDGTVELSWPMLRRKDLRNTILLGLLFLPVGYGALLFLWAFWYRRARARLVLGLDRLEFDRPGTPLERRAIGCDRDGLGLVIPAGNRLAVTLGGKRDYLARSWGVGGHVLSGDEIAWLYETLTAWKLGMLDRRAAPSREPREPLEKEGAETTPHRKVAE